MMLDSMVFDIGPITLSYVGPGAGVALIGSFLVVAGAIFSAFIGLLTWPIRRIIRSIRGRHAMAHAKVPRVVIIGLDGLEPTLTDQFLEQGLLPNLAALRERGGYHRLGTTCPPISPVAWSSFSTGANPGKHNIFDFLGRNPVNYDPQIATVRIREPRRKMKLGTWVIPLSKPSITAERRSRPFWSVLSDAGVFSAVLRVPITFPPDRFNGVQLAAMSVPDLLGSQGTYTLYAEPGSDVPDEDQVEGEGDRQCIEITQNNGRYVSYLRGPINSLRAEQPELRLPFTVTPSGDGSAVMRLDGQKIKLQPMKFTDWINVTFKAAPGVKVRGICRLYLKQIAPRFELYCTAIQIDPNKPVMPISHPKVYATYLAKLLGPYATLGLAEDTSSLSDGVMDDQSFLQQSYDIHEERERMMLDAVLRVPRGMITCVFDAPDRIQHMMWRYIDESHPARPPDPPAELTDAMRHMYQRMDETVGRIVAELRENDAVIVMSDHGFKPFRRGVDLNAWLRENGYLTLKEGAELPSGRYLADIDWSRTKAYAIGLTGIYVNQTDREGQGIVAEGDETQALIDEMAAKLTGLRDDDKDAVAVHEAIPRARAYHGPYAENAPDLIIGYREGYRVSWAAATGRCGETVFTDNTKAWSGDHCIHPDLVPGVLFTNLNLNAETANIIDVAPTVLELLGVTPPGHIDGKSLLWTEETSSN